MESLEWVAWEQPGASAPGYRNGAPLERFALKGDVSVARCGSAGLLPGDPLPERDIKQMRTSEPFMEE
jgi:hypothetical protein